LTTLAQLRKGYRLEALPTNHNPSLAALRLLAPVDGVWLEKQVGAARAAVADRDRALLRLESSKAAGDLATAGAVRRQRRSAAMVWLSLALQRQQLDSSAPGHAEMVAEARKALAAQPVTPVSGGMP
jgi:hypothetical protein